MPPDLVNIVGLYTGWNLYLWITAIVVEIIAAGLIFQKASKSKDVPSLHGLLLAYGFFMLAMGLHEVFFLLAYQPTYPSGFDPYNTGLGIGYICCSIALVPIVVVIEKYIVHKTHYFFSILAIILVGLCSLSLVPGLLLTLRTYLQLLGLGTAFIWFILYIWMAHLTLGSPVKKQLSRL